MTLGYDVNNLRIMAVKRVYIGSSLENSTALKEIQEESKLLSEFKHKNIVTYFGSEREKEFLKIYMEFVDGGSISSLIKTYGAFSDKVAARYTRQMLQGLEYLHYHNVVHRDIKGANVLVTRNGIVKLSDFGSAKRICSYEVSIIGTVAWMAPEARSLGRCAKGVQSVRRHLEPWLHCVRDAHRQAAILGQSGLLTRLR